MQQPSGSMITAIVQASTENVSRNHTHCRTQLLTRCEEPRNGNGLPGPTPSRDEGCRWSNNGQLAALARVRRVLAASGCVAPSMLRWSSQGLIGGESFTQGGDGRVPLGRGAAQCSLGTSTSEPSLFEPIVSWMKLQKSPITAGPEWLGRRNYKSMPGNGLYLE